MPSKPVFDAEAFREQILKAGKSLAKEGVFLTVKALRAHGVVGNECRIYKVRKQLVDAGLLPSDLIREHPIHRSTEKNLPVNRTPRPEGFLAAISSRGITRDMVRLYGGRRRLRREFSGKI